MSKQHLVAVIGAGPAGIYGTRKLAEAGHRVLLINRDIKPGGLAEYGIFLDKEKMKVLCRGHGPLRSKPWRIAGTANRRVIFAYWVTTKTPTS
jgi:NADPH-dependent glutamate synthase beta subunit-like oxidoreductase